MAPSPTAMPPGPVGKASGVEPTIRRRARSTCVTVPCSVTDQREAVSHNESTWLLVDDGAAQRDLRTHGSEIGRRDHELACVQVERSMRFVPSAVRKEYADCRRGGGR